MTTKPIMVGNVQVGGGALPVVQSMTNTDTRDVEATLAQIDRLVEAGCEIIRVAIPSASALDGFQAICARSPLPVVADIHFSRELAVEAAKRGASALRINPGNISDKADIDLIIEAAKEANIPIRIGVNAGSLDEKYQDTEGPLAFKLAASAIEFCRYFESRDFTNIVVSAKASSVPVTIEAYRILAREIEYPLHIGVTEAGTLFDGTIKSAVGLGTLLGEGIGDTLRVSLTADPVEEIRVAFGILGALDIRRRTPEMISCPTCGRCQVDLISLAEEVRERLENAPAALKVAVMGCVVNGPGEAREADFGIACGKDSGVVFAHGEPLYKVPEDELVDALFAEIEKAN